MKKYTKFVGLYLPEELNSQLNQFCKEREVDRSKLLRVAIEIYLEEMKEVK